MTRKSAGTWLALAGILALALALRLWNIDHNLPFAYNPDEELHFVPRAVEMLGGSLNPGYFENPPALTYLLLVLYRLGLAGGDLRQRFELDPTSAFVTARVAVALIGTLVVGLVFWAGARFADRRAGLVAAAVMAVAFLPVLYSKQALNDTVTLAPVTVALVGCLLAYRRGGQWDWVLAGAAVGAATATKYTAGAMLVTLAVAAALRVRDDRARLRSAIVGLAIGGMAFVAAFAVLNPFAILDAGEARSQLSGQSDQASTAKLGQEDELGWWYYLKTLTWGLGWAPLIAALGGAVVALRRDWRTALLLIAFPLVLWLYLGIPARHFGRWLLPVYPALCVLAGIAAVALVDRLRWRPAIATALLTAALCLQGLLASIHIDRVLGRADTRTLARAWIDRHIPNGAGVVVEPFVPGSWLDQDGGKRLRRYPVERPFQAYEKRLRRRMVGEYQRDGYCWVIVGSHQKDRGLAAGLRNARRYYRALERASEDVVVFSPYRSGADPVAFSYDFSFNYAPRAYERPGPVVEIHRLADCA